MYDRQKVLNIALAEVGYLEKASNANLDDMTANAGSANFTKYARDLDNIPGFYNGKKNGYAWCDVFVDWCFVQAYGTNVAKMLLCQPDFSAGAGCTYSAMYYQINGQFFTKDPQPGDQIFFGSAAESTHTGIVYAVDASKVYTVEGNTSGASGVISNGGGVCKKSYSLGNGKIYGYGRPKYEDDYEHVKVSQNGSSTIQETSSMASQNINGLIDTVREVQIWLNQNFASGLSLDGLYGTITKAALTKALQKTVGVTADGKYGSSTNRACSKLDLQLGSTGTAVKILQAFLVCNGYKAAYVDGEFGSGTNASLIDYQKKHGLDPDGIAAQATFKALCS